MICGDGVPLLQQGLPKVCRRALDFEMGGVYSALCWVYVKNGLLAKIVAKELKF